MSIFKPSRKLKGTQQVPAGLCTSHGQQATSSALAPPDCGLCMLISTGLQMHSITRDTGGVQWDTPWELVTISCWPLYATGSDLESRHCYICVFVLSILELGRQSSQYKDLSLCPGTHVSVQAWAGEMAQWVKALSVKPNDPSLIPEIQIIEGENQLQQVVI